MFPSTEFQSAINGLRKDGLDVEAQQSRVLEIFRRLPVRMALFRIFARDDTYGGELIKAANEVLGLSSS